MHKLPENRVSAEWMSNLQTIIDNKLNQMSVKSNGLNNKKQSKFDIILHNCESIIPIIKNILSKKPASSVAKKGK